MVRGTRTLTALLTSCALAAGSTLVLAPGSAGAAAPPSPDNLAVEEAFPRLSWDRVDGASSYTVVVSPADDPSTTLWQTTTVNHQVVPPVPLPDVPLGWRVLAEVAGSPSGYAEGGTFAVAAPHAPALRLPVDDAVVRQPDAPATLAWDPVPGATSYVVELGPDADFTDPDRVETFTTQGTTWTVEQGLPAGNRFHWRVKAVVDPRVSTEFSDPRSFSVLGLAAPTDPSPPSGSSVSQVQDVVLDWAPVAGAVRYEVRVSTDFDFDAADVVARELTVATRWSPPRTLVNDQYYWQVRPIDTYGTATPWPEDEGSTPDSPGGIRTWTFERTWPDQPALASPDHDDPGGPEDPRSAISEPLFVQWDPVPLASSYRVWLSTRPDFPAVPDVTRTCVTDSTTLVVDPARPSPTWCPLPAAATGRIFWKVQGIDGPGPVPRPAEMVTDVLADGTEVRSFVYDPGAVSFNAPADGETVDVPTMAWEPVQGAEQYKVSWTPLAGGTPRSVTTATTSYTPTTELLPGSYRWDVQPVTAGGFVGRARAPETQRTFTVATPPQATASQPDPLVAERDPSNRFPTLEWTPVAGADHYRLRLYRGRTSSTYTLASPRFDYPAGELTRVADLEAGTWGWQVEAYRGNGTLISVGGRGHFTIALSGEVLDVRAALSGTATGRAATSCDMRVDERGNPVQCIDLPQTPVIRWDQVPGASAYRVQVTLDQERTTRTPGDLSQEFWTTQPMWVFDQQLPDSQAGSAYYVSVRACKALDLLTCDPAEHSEDAFNKLSGDVELVSPPQDATVVDDVTFTWTDHLATNLRRPRGPGSTTATVGAMSYEVVLSTDEAFTTRPVVSATVDQTTFTAPATTLPEGPVFWRVRAVDGSGNTLPWSVVGRVTKRSPSPTTSAPARGAVVDGDEAFTWRPLPFAESYDLEIRTGPDTTRASLSARVDGVAFSPDEPLAPGTGYTWRVRRVDASGRAGSWTESVPFTVRRAALEPRSPAAAADVAPTGGFFSWTSEPRASRYELETRALGSTSVTRTRTYATAVAPTTALRAGDHEWRVVALDTAGEVLGESPWRPYRVQTLPTAEAPPVPDQVRVGESVIVQPPTWSVPQVGTTVQWFRGAAPITGAVDLTYVTTYADMATGVRAVFTGSRSGWSNGSVSTDVVAVSTGAAPEVTARPKVTGPGRVGTVLTASSVTWDRPGVTTGHRWLRDGSPIPGATGPTYTLASADVGLPVAVEVTGRLADHADGSALSDAVVVGKARATTRTALSPMRVRAGQRVTITTIVTAPGLTPSGSVSLRVDGRRVDGASLDPRGRYSFRYAPRSKGRHEVVVTYAGNAWTAGATSRPATLTVTR